MKKLIIIALIVLSNMCYAQSGTFQYTPDSNIVFNEYDYSTLITKNKEAYNRMLDSVRIIFDKDGNMIRKVYYSKKQLPEKSTLNLKVKMQDEKSPINKD